jgi:tRNA1Val (adenine37-N6)-methyltransferase
MSRSIALDDPVLGPLTDDLLTPSVRVYQRQKGHRFSSDDVATAYVAFTARPDAKRVLDLGCGLGSVLLLLAYKLPGADLAGIEAQAMSFALLERNVARSGFAARLQVLHGDLREPMLPQHFTAPFDLITGTPPYFPPAAALDAEDEQRAFARIEYRGGVEAYIGAGAPLLAQDGTLVLCGDARASERTRRAAVSAGLYLRAQCDVIARAGILPLFSIWTLARSDGPFSATRLILRGEDGQPTADAARLRNFSGFEPKSS